MVKIDKCELYKGDCLKILEKIEDNTVDLCIIDPPYKQKINSTGNYNGRLKRKYFNEIKDISNGVEDTVLEELCRVMKKINIYIFCNKEQILQYLRYFENKNCMMDLLVWCKPNPMPFANNRYLSDLEYILFFREKGVKVSGSYDTKKKFYIEKVNKKDKKKYNHPTIKPTSILDNFVINSSSENDVILDCFMGSGSTIVSALRNNRKAIGIELDNTYFEIAKNRIEDVWK